jgi:hypothetical protein
MFPYDTISSIYRKAHGLVFHPSLLAHSDSQLNLMIHDNWHYRLNLCETNDYGTRHIQLGGCMAAALSKSVLRHSSIPGSLAEHMECFPTALYWHMMVDDWIASDEQLIQMISEGSHKWALQG